MNTAALFPSVSSCMQIVGVAAAHLNGRRSFSRSTESSPPYHGQMTHICEEYEMNEIKREVPNTLSRQPLGPQQRWGCGRTIACPIGGIACWAGGSGCRSTR